MNFNKNQEQRLVIPITNQQYYFVSMFLKDIIFTDIVYTFRLDFQIMQSNNCLEAFNKSTKLFIDFKFDGRRTFQ